MSCLRQTAGFVYLSQHLTHILALITYTVVTHAVGSDAFQLHAIFTVVCSCRVTLVTVLQLVHTRLYLWVWVLRFLWVLRLCVWIGGIFGHGCGTGHRVGVRAFISSLAEKHTPWLRRGVRIITNGSQFW